MASRPITAWQIEGAKVEVVTDFLFLGSKITADSDCNHEIRSCLFLGRKAMTNLDSVLKSRDITLPKKVRIIKIMVFPVVIYSCESWTVKKAECQWIDAFELWSWIRLLRVSWTARSTQSILRKINPKYSLALVFWSSDVNRWLIGKVPHAGKDCGQKEKRVSEDEMAGQYHRCNEYELGNSGRCWGTGRPGMLQSMELKRIGHGCMTEQQYEKVLYLYTWRNHYGIHR